jgi:hypothetical protein
MFKYIIHGYLRFYYYHWVDIFAGSQCFGTNIWIIIYILQFLYNVIINKINVLLPQAEVTFADFNYPI